MLCTASNFKKTIENFSDYEQIRNYAYQRKEEVMSAGFFTQLKIYFIDGDYALPAEFAHIADDEAMKSRQINQKLKAIVGEDKYNQVVQEIEEIIKKEKEKKEQQSIRR